MTISDIPLWRFQTMMWVLCGLTTIALASRFYIRFTTKGGLWVNDYFLVVALPLIYIAAALLQFSLSSLYSFEFLPLIDRSHPLSNDTAKARDGPMLVAAVEMLWITIYCVKLCFLTQFKFHKPPYAYVSIHLTRYWWSAIVACIAAFVFTLIAPIVICPNEDKCRYFSWSNSVFLEMFVTAMDLVIDLIVISIPALLIRLAHFQRSKAVINTTFKILSVVNIAIAATRLGFQYDPANKRIDYIWSVFLLFMEAGIALIMAAISAYRVLVIDWWTERSRARANSKWSKSHLSKQKRTSEGGNDLKPTANDS